MRHTGWIAAIALLGTTAGTAQAEAPAATAPQAAPAPAAPAADAPAKPVTGFKRVRRVGTPTTAANSFLPIGAGAYAAVFAAGASGVLTARTVSPE